jgi:hypothetical protein
MKSLSWVFFRDAEDFQRLRMLAKTVKRVDQNGLK